MLTIRGVTWVVVMVLITGLIVMIMKIKAVTLVVVMMVVHKVMVKMGLLMVVVVVMMLKIRAGHIVGHECGGGGNAGDTGGSDGQIGICTNGNDLNTLNNSKTNLL